MKNTAAVLVLIVIAGFITLVGCEKKTKPTAEVAQQTEQTAATEQTVCPVMAGNPIDKNIFVEYKGKKVYFCCKGCVADFNKDPEKYISKLPQFKQ